MSIVLKHQVEASEQAADEIEKGLENHKIDLCYEVQSLLRGLVVNAKNLRDFVERGHTGLSRGAPSFDAREVDTLYRQLESIFRRTHELTLAAKSIAGGYKIEGEEEFHSAWAELQGIICFSLDLVSIASEQADRGEGRELTEFMNELHC